MDLAQRTNEGIRLLWRDTIESDSWPDSLPRRWPLQYPEFHTPAVVFVGLNPSFTEREARSCGERPITDTAVLVSGGGREQLCDSTVVPRSAYYDHFTAFIDGTSISHWAHLDLFAIRETNQWLVRTALGLDGVWTDFADRQFAIFRETLDLLHPPVIVVGNALASHILRSRLDLGQLCPENGCHFAQIGGRPTPIFFSGMLTGQRALDVHSRERLIWHVKKILASRPPTRN